MSDPRTERLATVLVHHSTRIQPGDRVGIEGEIGALPLVRALFERILQAGGLPYLLLSPAGMITRTGFDASFLKYAGEAQLDAVPEFHKLVYDTFESRIRIYSSGNTRQLTTADKAKSARRGRAVQGLLRSQFERGARGEFKWVTTLFPTQALAQDAEKSLEDFEDFVYRACHVADEGDPTAYWKETQAEQSRLAASLSNHDRVEVRGPRCDLKFSIRQRTFVGSNGIHNMPDGEVFTGPVEDSAEGWVGFDFPAIHEGREVQGVELTFRQGRVVEAKAAKNEAYLLEMLETDPGARYLGEFGVGTNNQIQDFTRNILFDEKIGGTIHLALGSGYPDTGSHNRSAIHWDMLCDMRQGGEILFDGQTVYRDGRFLV
ncbi:MAG TPA: aminopeptidase [Anaerolineales bacterium]|nr:aminopeptidase [Anaerolineales bacterium]